MSRFDEQGYLHPTDNDLLETNALVHLAFCRECNQYALPLPEPFESLRSRNRAEVAHDAPNTP